MEVSFFKALGYFASCFPRVAMGYRPGWTMRQRPLTDLAADCTQKCIRSGATRSIAGKIPKL